MTRSEWKREKVTRDGKICVQEKLMTKLMKEGKCENPYDKKLRINERKEASSMQGEEKK